MPIWWRRAKFSNSRAARERKIEHKVPTLTAAAIDDVAGWTILAIVTAVVKSQFRPPKESASSLFGRVKISTDYSKAGITKRTSTPQEVPKLGAAKD